MLWEPLVPDLRLDPRPSVIVIAVQLAIALASLLLPQLFDPGDVLFFGCVVAAPHLTLGSPRCGFRSIAGRGATRGPCSRRSRSWFRRPSFLPFRQLARHPQGCLDSVGPSSVGPRAHRAPRASRGSGAQGALAAD